KSSLALANNSPASATTTTPLARGKRANGNAEKRMATKSKRTLKKIKRYVPHQSGMEANLTTMMMAMTWDDDNLKMVNFNKLTHRVTMGKFQFYEGEKLSEDDSHMTLSLIKNRSGKKMISARTVVFEKTQVEELDSYDMIASIDTKFAEEEDDALVEYEQQHWECPKCQHSNRNDAGYCPNMVGSKQCGGTKRCKMLSWGSCFAQAPQTWKCCQCTTPNLLKEAFCVVCGYAGNETLSARHVLHPELYPPPSHRAPSTSPSSSSSSLLLPPLTTTIPPPSSYDHDDDAVPLAEGMRLLMKSLERIVDDASSSSTTPTSVMDNLDGSTLLRIEQRISGVHSIDPLCWMHAQRRRVIADHRRDARRWTGTGGGGGGYGPGGDVDGTVPAMYFGDMDGRVEAAARMDEMVNAVGGGGDNDLGDDWDGFGGDGGGYWILPAVELRREILEVGVNNAPMSGDEARDEIKDDRGKKTVGTRVVTLAVHLHNVSPSSSSSSSSRTHQNRAARAMHRRSGWRDAAHHVLTILRELTDELSPAVPCTTLPPIITRSESTGNEDDDGDSGLAFERGVAEALRRIRSNVDMIDDDDGASSLRKVVLARKVDLNFGSSVSGLDVLMRLKFGGHIGHLFYMDPGGDGASGRPGTSDTAIRSREFFGCTPERLFRVFKSGHDRVVTTEALAGTRIRGLTQSADNELLRELLSSKKDMLENDITGQFIDEALLELEENGWLEKRNEVLKSYDFDGNTNVNGDATASRRRYFVRRLRHLQHICQIFEGKLSEGASVIDVSRSLLKGLHPTPAVCGDSPCIALEFIRKYETVGFDRGYYAGPFGYIGHDSADIVVAIRSALVTNYDYYSNDAELRHNSQKNENDDVPPESKISIFAGAGIVEGSTVQEEWTEISHKVGVLASLFRSSPITLQTYSMPNVAWTTAFIEELVRCGVTQFYICPGSRNTPLTAAIFRSMRSNVGIVRAISIHDERGAGFRAVGYARQNGRPAAVVTSSGTAVANLYPSIVEASSDGVPLILITADRPYENRDNGSNQSVDQVKIFSSSYVRWFRDILPPSDDVPVSVTLSDANHAVAITKQLMGPVHLNVQFRENLAPEGGPIRNDNRIGSMTQFNHKRFTDVPGFSRWSSSGNCWQQTFYPNINAGHSIMEVAELIINSRRGIIVTGNLRGADSDGADLLTTAIAHLAKVIGFPIFASVQSGGLRREHPVVQYAEHLLKNPLVSNGMQPDLILQLGSPLISTEISQVMRSNPSVYHVLVQKLYQHERADPEQTVTHRVSSDVRTFVNSLISCLGSGRYFGNKNFGSQLSPLLYLGRKLGDNIRSAILDTSSTSEINGEAYSDDFVSLTEPQVMMAITDVLSESSSELSSMSLFLSNSMPVRDGEFFFYPSNRNKNIFPLTVSVNRGASGIDGIISTATGCGDNAKPTTLVCGDVTTLHDLNAFYGLTHDDASSSDDRPASATNRIPLTTVIVNNGGGAIFSFLPISKFGEDVGFEEFWGTPTDNFSFQKGVAAFGLPYTVATSFNAFKDAYRTSIMSSGPNVIEARVVGRAANVAIHQKITGDVRIIVDEVLRPPPTRDRVLPVKTYRKSLAKKTKTMLLLHGWMGDKSEWDLIGDALSLNLPEEWNIISIDMPGHGDSSVVLSSDQQVAHSSLGLDAMRPFGPPESSPFSLDMMARAVCHSLIHDHGVEQLNAIVGYSLGGRIALAMKRLYSMSLNSDLEGRSPSMFLTDQTKLILLSSNPGKLPNNTNHGSTDDFQRLSKDYSIAESLFSSAYRSYVTSDVQDLECLTRFLTNWYTQSLWGDLRTRHPIKHKAMMTTRLKSLVRRRLDIASVLYGCSPSLSSQEDWKAVVPSATLFIAGELDKKYSSIGRAWDKIQGISRYIELENTGHAVILEEPEKLSFIISDFVNDVVTDHNDINLKDMRKNEVYNPILSEYSIPVEKGEIIVPSTLHQVGIMDYEAFRITVGSGRSGLLGIGWGESAQAETELKSREGFIISIASRDGMAVGVGEVSPLSGLHMESLEQSENQLKLIQKFLASNATRWPEFDAKRVLSLDGSLTICVNAIFNHAGIDSLYAAQSVRSGLEMAILSVSSQLSGKLLPQALAINQQQRPRSLSQLFGQLPINGLITRGETANTREVGARRRGKEISFKSVKIKVGHGDPSEDVLAMIRLKAPPNGRSLKLRADANRAWDFPTAQLFINELKMSAQAGSFVLNDIEFLEEPLEVQTNGGKWSFRSQIAALEGLLNGKSLSYALDETLADLAVILDYDFDRIERELVTVFGEENVGRKCCAAFVLKPALLGLELSMRLARLAQKEFQISPVFSSSFDSGIGLAYTAILAALSDNSPHSLGLSKFSHGLGTFDKLDGDTMSPPFESYVNDKGFLNIPSLSRALYGLSLDEMSDRVPTFDNTSETAVTATESDSYLATTSFTSGRDVTVSVSLPLPFSDRIASSRFTDLPQMSRWSPWLNSVTYLDESPGLTEWNLNIRGVKFNWRAKSEILTNPKGIQWDSISGLKNRGVVEFEPTSEDSCVMRLRMSIIMPHILVALFQGMPSVVQEFLQNKLLKWSLEMFRDVVKADLALERGDQELGDALFGAVEGRANALEEALK
ncbi:hypothetical protein ACHAXA_007515, partial [Cyclostephanos tholiformis]